MFDGDPVLLNSVSIFFEIRFIKFGQKFGWPLPPPHLRNLAAQNIKISAKSRLDREYLRNATTQRQSENSVAHYGYSRTGKLNSVYFGPQTANIGPEFLPAKPGAISQRIATHLVVYYCSTFARWCHYKITLK